MKRDTILLVGIALLGFGVFAPNGPSLLNAPTSTARAQTAATTLSKSDQPTTRSDSNGSKNKAEVALSSVAIAALIVAASRDEYHSTGHPCACPDDTMRNGRACGGRSAYSRPGGAAPLCYLQDVTATMIEAYRQKTAQKGIL